MPIVQEFFNIPDEIMTNISMGENKIFGGENNSRKKRQQLNVRERGKWSYINK